MADIRDEQIFNSWKQQLQQHMMPQNINPYYEFMGAWIMFNSVYRQPMQIRGNAAQLSEREKVVSFAAADAFGNLHTTLLADNRYHTAVQYISQRTPPAAPPGIGAFSHADVRVWNLARKNTRDTQGICTGDADLEGLLGCLYVIRCNLFHGDKAAGNHADVELVGYATVILSELLLGYVLL